MRAATAWRSLSGLWGRGVRFGLTGLLAGMMQLASLRLMLEHGWQPWIANLLSFVSSAQLNFVLSNTFTWRDRQLRGGWLGRWLRFHALIAWTAILNLGVFDLADRLTPHIVAAVIAIAVVATTNFLGADRFVFRSNDRTQLEKGEALCL